MPKNKMMMEADVCNISPQEANARVAEIARALLFSPVSPEPPAGCGNDVNEIYNALLSVRNTILAFSKGNLDTTIKLKGTMGGALKTLQANLRHLGWIAKTVAEGDYTQRVEYMGEFASSFNSMVETLESTTGRLLQEIAEKNKIEKELRASEKKYRKMALLDPLTEMYNRRHFLELAGAELERAQRNITTTSVAMMDVDYFKNFNDTFGHLNGDKCLKMIAAMLLKQIRKIDLAARYGGEEFVILFPQTGMQSAVRIAERIRGKIAAMPIDTGTATAGITVSIGIAEIPAGQLHAENLDKILMAAIDRADNALYRAKVLRNKVVTA